MARKTERDERGADVVSSLLASSARVAAVARGAVEPLTDAEIESRLANGDPVTGHRADHGLGDIGEILLQIGVSRADDIEIARRPGLDLAHGLDLPLDVGSAARSRRARRDAAISRA